MVGRIDNALVENQRPVWQVMAPTSCGRVGKDALAQPFHTHRVVRVMSVPLASRSVCTLMDLTGNSAGLLVKAVFTTKVEPGYDGLPEQRYHFPNTYCAPSKGP
jgi:hypothetical protein